MSVVQSLLCSIKICTTLGNQCSMETGIVSVFQKNGRGTSPDRTLSACFLGPKNRTNRNSAGMNSSFPIPVSVLI